MEDFTLIHFLDRFVYKNPKRSKDKKKAKKSVFQPNRTIQKSAIKDMPVNSKEYLKLDPSKIPENEKLFYKYFLTFLKMIKIFDFCSAITRLKRLENILLIKKLYLMLKVCPILNLTLI